MLRKMIGIIPDLPPTRCQSHSAQVVTIKNVKCPDIALGEWLLFAVLKFSKIAFLNLGVVSSYFCALSGGSSEIMAKGFSKLMDHRLSKPQLGLIYIIGSWTIG